MAQTHFADFKVPTCEDKTLEVNSPDVAKWGKDFIDRLAAIQHQHVVWNCNNEAAKVHWKLITSRIRELDNYYAEPESWDEGAHDAVFDEEEDEDEEGGAAKEEHSPEPPSLDQLRQTLAKYEGWITELHKPTQLVSKFFHGLLRQVCGLIGYSVRPNVPPSLSHSTIAFGNCILQGIVNRLSTEWKDPLIEIANAHFDVSGLDRDAVYAVMATIACGKLFEDEQKTTDFFVDALSGSVGAQFFSHNCTELAILPAATSIGHDVWDAKVARLRLLFQEQGKLWDPLQDFCTTLEGVWGGAHEFEELTEDQLYATPEDFLQFGPTENWKRVRVDGQVQLIEAQLAQALSIPELEKAIRAEAKLVVEANGYVIRAAGCASAIIRECLTRIKACNHLRRDVGALIISLDTECKQMVMDQGGDVSPIDSYISAGYHTSDDEDEIARSPVSPSLPSRKRSFQSQRPLGRTRSSRKRIARAREWSKADGNDSDDGDVEDDP